LDISSSIEVRWFLDDASGTEATAAKAWFAGVSPQRTREDRYLLTGRDDIGFKARVEGDNPAKLETKYLLGSLGPAMLHERIVGNVERWRKLSLEAHDPALEKSGEWIRVAKTRRLRKFACEGRVVRQVDAMSRLDVGCAVEVTELEYDAAAGPGQAMTIGLDAFGPTESLLDVLLRVCETALASVADLRLGFDRSESYPRWLARIAASRGTPPPP
jgi:hypothetical protein